MSEREICGACRGPWPCECSPQAVSVVMMPSVDDDYATALAKRMRSDPDAPLRVSAYEPEPVLKVDLGYGRRIDDYCGHYANTYEVNTDKRIVWCRGCGTVLDAYDVLTKLAGIERRLSERLKAAQELEQREKEREAGRMARAKVRRHRYASIYSRGRGEYCSTCGGATADRVHTRDSPARR